MRKCLAIVQLVGKLQARVTIQKDDKCEDAASILGLMMLAAEQGEQIQLSATGPDAEEAIRAIIELLDTELDAQPVTRAPWRPRLPR
jgi:phosphotransferase system HPr (HPr) family protein